ncbi:MAG: DUF5110 domain-containing protein [Chitinispirillaceae bacterium]|nr:DUF5110 domain-containing protein [Chitinispirillaceae bacterium]
MKKIRTLPVILSCIIVIGSNILSGAAAQSVSSFTKESDGALCVLSNNARLKLQVCGENIIRVVYTMGTDIPAPQGLIVARSSFSLPASWDATDNGTAIVVTTARVRATVTKSNALISFASASGTTVCSETARSLTATSKGGTAGFSGTLSFDSPSNEGVYGLGNLSLAMPAWTGDPGYWAALPPDNSGVLNIRGFTVDMHQSNWYDVIPFFMTTRGYGVLMNFACHATKTPPLTFAADFLLNNSWDYYFVYGPQFDTIIAGYRHITGPATMLAKWAFGFWQCKNRYASANELTTAVSQYRTRGIPLDCIVQDWQWWSGGQNGWGTFAWDAVNYPDPSGMISTIHDNHCHFAISIWPTFFPGTPHYSSMEPHLLLSINCNDFPGEFLNVFDTTGMRKYWDLIKTSCVDNDVDAWWMDATEPECPLLTGVNTSMGMIDLYANAYSMVSCKYIYEKQRAISSSKRVVNLTRSMYAGQHRFGAIYWNGDISGNTMNNVKTTIAGGLNSCMAGNPYWCSDIGGFQNDPTDEILTRWFQAGTFFPIFRVHGSRNTEIYNMSASTQQICIAFSKLRYRLMPYIYSLAWKVTNEGYTMTRALPFDFPDDASVKNIADQFMFGPALLINPVAAAGVTSRNVYLPSGTWYDFWTGAANTGAAGRIVTNVAAPIQRIPIYARAGAILPMGPNIQYATQSADPIELRIYPGADGNFTLYEDEGDGYGYESGRSALIPISYSAATGRVTIGSRTGTFPGMLASRTFNIVFVAEGKGVDTTVTPTPDCVIPYTGSPVSGCPVSVICRKCRPNPLNRQASFSLCAQDRIVLPASYAGEKKHLAVYDCSGRLVHRSIVTAQAVSLRNDIRLSNGVYIVKISAAEQPH